MNRKNFEWKGYAAIQKTLNQLPNLETQNKAINSAFRSASIPTQSALEQLAPFDTGGLSNSFGYAKAKGEIIDYGKVGAMKKKGGYHGHWFEEGTKDRYTKSGWYTGRITHDKFFTKAWTANIMVMRGIIENRISKIVVNYFKKLHKSNNGR